MKIYRVESKVMESEGKWSIRFNIVVDLEQEYKCKPLGYIMSL